MNLRILVDENIPFGKEVFSRLGEVTTCHGRKITPQLVRDQDALVVRSITKVNAELLQNSRVSFVGTATIGTDHVDQEYLQQARITFASAAGCNANSVAEYIVSALLWLEQNRGIELSGKTLGVVGVGNVGRRVVEKARGLGLKVLQNDPPRAKQEGPGEFVSLEQILRESDLITLHTPLTRGGEYPTHYLLDSTQFATMPPGRVVLNTSRGAVVNNNALKQAIASHHLAGCVLDVWENEPTVDLTLLGQVDLATPHIAGYSLDGKITGTRMMFEALVKHLGIPEQWDAQQCQVAITDPLISLSAGDRTGLYQAVNHAYNIAQDDQRMRTALLADSANIGEEFDRLRKEYPVRREFPGYQIAIPDSDNCKETAAVLSALGFQLQPALTP